MSFVVTVSIILLGMVNSILLARWLGPTGRGEVAAALLWPLIFPYLGATGLIDTVVVFAARRDSDLRKILGSSLAFSCILSVALCTIGYASLPFLIGNQRPQVVEASRMLLLVIPIILVVEFISQVLRARMLFGLYNVQRFVQPIGYLAGSVALEWMDQLTVMNIVLLQIGLFYIRLLVALLLCRVGQVELRVRFDRVNFRQMLSFGSKSHIGAVAEHGNTHLDQALIAAWLPPAQLGLYVAAVSASSMMKALSSALKLTILPMIAREESQAKQDSILVRGFRFYWTVSWAVSPFFALALYWLIPLVYGVEFSGAVLPAIVLIIGANVFGAKDLLSTSARAIGLPWLGSRAELVALLITVIMLAILIPSIGIIGAAVTSVVAYAVSLGIVMKGIRRVRQLSIQTLLAPAMNPVDIARSVLRS